MSFKENNNEFLNRLLKRLREEKDTPIDGRIEFSVDELMRLCEMTILQLQKDEMLIQIDAPVDVYGDIHGQFTGLMMFLEKYGFPDKKNILFLGDYIDRGPNSIEVLVTIFTLKCLYPDRVSLLRGNHETRETTQLYGFAEECRVRYSSEVYNMFLEVFRYLPISAIIGDRIFCVHGGISSNLKRLSQITSIDRPLDIQDGSLVQDLLWSDPSPSVNGYQKSGRGTAFTFGCDAANEFLKNFDFDLICRSHQAAPEGYSFPFAPVTSVVTIFSAANYTQGQPNRPAIMSVNENLACSFNFL
jgi:serine/threonine-protein phosphatase PP1 catalytic subunit